MGKTWIFYNCTVTDKEPPVHGCCLGSDNTPCAHTGKEQHGFTKAYECTQSSYNNLRAHRIKGKKQILIATLGSCNSPEVCGINSENGMNHQNHDVGLTPHHSKCITVPGSFLPTVVRQRPMGHHPLFLPCQQPMSY